MKLWAVVLMSMVAFVTCDDEIKTEENVLVLTTDNFDEALAAHDYILVEFYAPWCGHCKSLAPEYSKAADILKEEGSSIVIAKVDATEETSLAEKYEVKGFPTLKFFKQGDIIPFLGARYADGIISWLKKKSGPSALEVTTVDEIEKFREENEALAVGFFKPDQDFHVRAFLRAADGLDETICIYTHSSEAYKYYKINANNTVVLFKKFDNGRDDMREELSVKQIKDFVNVNTLPLVVEFTQQNAGKLFNQEKLRQQILLFTNFTAETKDQIKEDFKSVALLHRYEYLFIMVNTDGAENNRVFDYFGVDTTKTVSLRCVNLTTDAMEKYKPDTDGFNAGDLETFILGLKNGMYKKYLKAQELPEDWNSESVWVLTADNLDEVAKDQSKSVLVEFYAPWCGHCKKLEPILDKLGEHYKDNDDVVIAKVDATANEFEDFTIPSFPTIKYYPKGRDEILEYDGAKDFLDFTRYIKYDGNPPEEEDDDEESQEKDEL